jgi:hypothetical protein
LVETGAGDDFHSEPVFVKLAVRGLYRALPNAISLIRAKDEELGAS